VRLDSLLLLILFGGLLFLMFSRTRRQQREIQQVQANLRVGVLVMTTAGLYATVVEVDDQVVVLETAPGQRSRWDRRAVSRILPEESSTSVNDGVAGTAPSGEDTAPPDRDCP
jgi:preprotein translocase subunit YajC